MSDLPRVRSVPVVRVTVEIQEPTGPDSRGVSTFDTSRRVQTIPLPEGFPESAADSEAAIAHASELVAASAGILFIKHYVGE